MKNALDNRKQLTEAMDKSNRGKERLQKEIDLLDLKVKKKEKLDILNNNKTDKTIKDMLDAYEKNPDAFTFDQLKELNIRLINDDNQIITGDDIGNIIIWKFYKCTIIFCNLVKSCK